MTEIIKHKKESPILGLTGAGGGLTGLAFGGAVITPDGQQDYLAGYDSISWFTGGTFSWLCPPGVTAVSVVCIGGGGGGSGGSNNGLASGGGGGALAYKNNISVSPGTSYTVVVGSGRYSGTVTEPDGGDSYFGSTSTVMAKGGGSPYGGSGNLGGSASASVGDATYDGGDGGSSGSGGGKGGDAPGTNGGDGADHTGSGTAAAGFRGTSGSGGGGGNTGSNTNGCGAGGLAPLWYGGYIGAGGGGGGTVVNSSLAKGAGGGGGGTVGNMDTNKKPTDGYGTPYCAAGTHFDLRIAGYGGLFGGGGGAHGYGNVLWSGGAAGAVRILWATSGLTRAYGSPATNIGNV